jgi:integrase
MSNSTAVERPAKPRPDFPLFPHRNGRWAKKVRGSFVYFTHWATDPKGEAAVNQWLDQKDDLLAGRKPREKHDGKTVADLVNGFYTAKKRLVESGERKKRTLDDYVIVGKKIGEVFGRNRLLEDLTPEDFAELRASFAKTHGPVALMSDITRTKVIFNWGKKANILKRPVDYGDEFNRPEQRIIRLQRAANGPRMFERDQLLAMLNGKTVKHKKVAGATMALRAMLLLAINGGLGNSDLAQLPLSALDLKNGWLTYPRPKTGINRRIPLWAETIQALKKWIAHRPKAKEESNANLVFLTNAGNSWAKTQNDNPVSKETAKLLKRLGIHRPGLNFYSVRRTFRTIASGSLDEAACDFIMGHAPASHDMAARYRQMIPDDRLVAVTDYVRAWLFDAQKKK